jgi:hypothetical protein
MATTHEEALLRRSIAHFEATGSFMPPEAFAIGGSMGLSGLADDEGRAPGCFVGALRLFGLLPRAALAGAEPAAAAASKPASAASARLDKVHSDIEKRSATLCERAAALRASARAQMAAGDKRTALASLKRCKLVEKQAESAMNTSMMLEQQMDMLEMTAVQRSVATALSGATKSAKRGTKGLLSKAENAVESAEELSELQTDVSTVLGELGGSVGAEYDDDELAAELQSMLEEPDATATAAAAPAAVVAADTSLFSSGIESFPSVPVHGNQVLAA